MPIRSHPLRHFHGPTTVIPNPIPSIDYHTVGSNPQPKDVWTATTVNSTAPFAVFYDTHGNADLFFFYPPGPHREFHVRTRDRYENDGANKCSSKVYTVSHTLTLYLDLYKIRTRLPHTTTGLSNSRDSQSTLHFHLYFKTGCIDTNHQHSSVISMNHVLFHSN